MFTRTIHLIIGSLFSTAPASTSTSECAEFQMRASFLDSTWERFDHHGEALVLLAMYPQGCAPAERFVLAKRLLDFSEPNSPLVHILLRQGIREHRRGALTLVNLVAQVELLEHMASRDLILLRPGERTRLRALAEQTDALIERRPRPGVNALFLEYRSIANSVLKHAGGRTILLR